MSRGQIGLFLVLAAMVVQAFGMAILSGYIGHCDAVLERDR